MNIPYVMKKCTKCGEWKVASSINFHRRKDSQYGLASQCKECYKKYRKQYYGANKEKTTEYRKQYYEKNKEKMAEQHKRWYENNKEKILEHQKQYYENNKEKMAEYRKQYYTPEYSKQYREANKEKMAEQHKRYRRTPKGQVAVFNSKQRRRVKGEQQGAGITKDQWLEMMSFFDWKCAYSGEALTNKTRSVDHIVPLNSGGDNAIWNCVPMIRSLNSSKHTSNMEEWYKEQDCYDPKRLQKIYKWQEYAYNKWGKDSEYFNTNDIQIKLI